MKYCKYCGKELKESAKFCPSCGSPTGRPVSGNLNEISKNLEPSKDIFPVPDNSNKTIPLEVPGGEIKFPQTGNNIAKNEQSPFSRDKVPKSKFLPFLYGIIPILIVAGITVFLYKTNMLSFISRASSPQKNTLSKKENISPKENTIKEIKKTVKPPKTATASKSKVKAIKEGVTHVYPKTLQSSRVLPYAPKVNTYQPAYRVNHIRTAFNALRNNFSSTQAKLASFLPGHVSGQSSISFVVISHVYSFASNPDAGSTETFKVEFTAAVPQNMNASSVKIISKIGGQNGFIAKNISFENLSSSGVYIIEIPVRIPAYLAAGSYYFNAEVEVPGMFLTSGNAYFRVE